MFCLYNWLICRVLIDRYTPRLTDTVLDSPLLVSSYHMKWWSIIFIPLLMIWLWKCLVTQKVFFFSFLTIYFLQKITYIYIIKCILVQMEFLHLKNQGVTTEKNYNKKTCFSYKAKLWNCLLSGLMSQCISCWTTEVKTYMDHMWESEMIQCANRCILVFSRLFVFCFSFLAISFLMNLYPALTVKAHIWTSTGCHWPFGRLHWTKYQSKKNIPNLKKKWNKMDSCWCEQWWKTL